MFKTKKQSSVPVIHKSLDECKQYLSESYTAKTEYHCTLAYKNILESYNQVMELGNLQPTLFTLYQQEILEILKLLRVLAFDYEVRVLIDYHIKSIHRMLGV